MADFYMVTVEASDGSFCNEPECFDTSVEASIRGSTLALRHKDKAVTMYSCDAVRVFDAD